MPGIDFDLILIYEERTGDILFLVGTILAILSTIQAEQAAIAQLTGSRIQDNSAKSLATASWLFFIASIAFAHVAIARLILLRHSPPQTSRHFFLGSQYTVIGNIIKAVGFFIAAVGNQLKASTPSSNTVIIQ